MSHEVTLRWKDPALGRLNAAVEADDVDAARHALIEGADPNVPGLGLLHRVAADGSAEMAAVLLAHRAERDGTDFDGWTALTVADSWGNDGVAAALVAAGADEAQRTIHGFTELHRAVRLGDLDAIGPAITSVGANAMDAAGDTALLQAIERRSDVAIERLLAAGTDPNLHGPSWSPLTAAVYQDTLDPQDTDYTRLLLDAGADANPLGVPPIMKTINQFGARPELIDLLISHGADIDAVDPRDGATLLHEISAVDDDPALVATAVAAGASLDSRNHRGRTPLHMAADAAHASVVAALLRAGADQDAVDEDGRRALDLVGTDRILSASAVDATRSAFARS